jgi:hypothetical protein
MRTTYTLGLILKLRIWYFCFCKYMYLIQTITLMKCNQSHRNGLGKILTCNYRTLDSTDMP